MDAIEGSALWYEAVAKMIEVLLEGVGITINAMRDPPTTGWHRYHEALLDEVTDHGNPYCLFLGQDTAHEGLQYARTRFGCVLVY